MSDFANSKEIAILRYLKFYNKDPYPAISPALLNSADIQAYVEKTGMICPFYPDDLKPASYSLCLLGNYIYWDKDGNKKEDKITKGKTFELERDSIAFVSLEPLFHLPNYIAARFNLKIDNIYKGLLLGTGPLVDPGFIGYLSFPLHNLTSNKYTFVGGEEIVWMEFTKLSENYKWNNSIPKSQFEYVANKKYNRYIDSYKESTNKQLSKFFYESVQSRVSAAKTDVKSTIPDSIKRLRDCVVRAEVISWIALVPIIFTVLFIIFNVISITNETRDYIKTASEKYSFDRHIIDSLNTKLNSLEIKIDSLKKLNRLK